MGWVIVPSHHMLVSVAAGRRHLPQAPHQSLAGGWCPTFLLAAMLKADPMHCSLANRVTTDGWVGAR